MTMQKLAPKRNSELYERLYSIKSYSSIYNSIDENEELRSYKSTQILIDFFKDVWYTKFVRGMPKLIILHIERMIGYDVSVHDVGR